MVMGETPYQKPKLSGSCCGSRPSISGRDPGGYRFSASDPQSSRAENSRLRNSPDWGGVGLQRMGDHHGKMRNLRKRLRQGL
jgi:hypothetical protein